MTKKKLICLSCITAIALVVIIIAGGMLGTEANTVKADDSDVALVLQADKSTAYAGDEVTVTVDMTKNVGLTGIRFRIDFDVNALELISVKASNTLPFPTVNKADGFVGYAFALINQDDEGNDCDWTVTGSILTIKFKVKENAQFGETKLSFDMSQTDATDLAVNTLNISADDLTLEVSCKHANTEEIVTKESTCTAKGEKTIKCTVCGEVVKTEEIAAKGHTSGTAEVTKEATCTEKGEKVTKCTVCGETVKTEEIAAKGHTSGTAEVTKEATCTEKGEKVTKCTVCGETVKTEEIAAKGHTLGTAEVTKEATCIEKGEKVTKCTVCGETVKTEEIAAKGHTSGTAEVTKEATCTEKGEKVTKCTVCGETVKTEEITAKGHSYGEYTVTKEATCTERGEKTAVCATCKDEIKEEIPAKGHVYESCKIIKEPTETENGEMELVCSVCQNTVKKDVPKLSDIVFSVVESDGTALDEAYVVGSVVKFEAKVYGNVANPQVGSIRYVPVSYKLNGVETKFAEDSYASELKLDNEGEYAFAVVYARELYEAAGWKADGATLSYATAIKAEAKAVIEDETTTTGDKVDTPDTGDGSAMNLLIYAMVVIAAGAIVINRNKIFKAN